MAKGRVTKEDWTMAALRAFARGGVAAMAVDVLARELGVSRGSFYWHFENRDALLVAALEAWERHATTEVIAAVDDHGDPWTRARTLLLAALGDEGIAGLEPALGAARDAHPAVAEVVDRVTRTRIGYLQAVFADLGLDPADARRRAVAAYAAYLGWLDLRRTAPDIVPEVVPGTPAAEAALEHLVSLLGVPPAPGGATGCRAGGGAGGEASG
ncbi:TetR/AcrR family transcriptional regulator [Streptomyces erythrochromogenes]|uniref:TetR/AcrR family transcriptional regulator n=1 Tax=Streptomyces erythrochromogenes TaxID=285574 RepID=UPI00367631D4